MAGKGDQVTYIDGEGNEHAATVTESYDNGNRCYLRINESGAIKDNVLHESVSEDEDARVGRFR